MKDEDDDDDDVTPITRSLDDDDSRFDTHQLNTPTTTTVQQRLEAGRPAAAPEAGRSLGGRPERR